MKTRVRKWGKDLAVRISKGISQQSGVAVGDLLAVDVDGNGAIVLTPTRRQKYRLHDLLKGMTKRNMHDEVRFSGSAGREIW